MCIISIQRNTSKGMLKVQSRIYITPNIMDASSQITDNELVAVTTVLVFMLLSHKVLFVNRKDN